MISKTTPHFLSPSTEPTRQRRPKEKIVQNPKAKLRDQVHEVMRFHRYSARTEETYWQWIVRFLKFHRGGASLAPALSAAAEGGEKVWRHPREMGATEVHGFLTHLAAERNVSASTQNQALNALVFFVRGGVARASG
jgi:hypothetical protein